MFEHASAKAMILPVMQISADFPQHLLAYVMDNVIPCRSSCRPIFPRQGPGKSSTFQLHPPHFFYCVNEMGIKEHQLLLRAVLFFIFRALVVSALFIESCTQPVVISRLDPITEPGLQSSFGALSIYLSDYSQHSTWFHRLWTVRNVRYAP